jgi:hypothetical protein
MTEQRPTRASDNPALTDATLLQEALALAAACDAYTARAKWRSSSLTVQFLLGRSIELALKAYLIYSRKTTEKELRSRALGHQLLALWDAAHLHGLKLPDDVETDRPAIDILNSNYADKLFEYPLVQGYVVVPTAMLRRLLHRLLSTVFSSIWGEERYAFELRKKHAASNGIAIAPDAHYEEPHERVGEDAD